tara:strand:+ start:582 stop:1184 length:603 start_codon:yes stop_codon:yes gene_type:complete
MGTLEKILNILKMKNEVKSYSVKFYAEMKLDDGRIVATEDEQFAIGSKVFAISDDGEATPLEAGSYTMENGNILTIGESSDILDMGDEAEEVEAKEEEEEMSEEVVDESKEEMSEEVEEEVKEEVKEELKEEEPVMMSSDLIGELMTKIEDLESKIVELSKEPAEDGIKYNPEGTKKVNKKSLISLSHHERVRELINNYK